DILLYLGYALVAGTHGHEAAHHIVGDDLGCGQVLGLGGRPAHDGLHARNEIFGNVAGFHDVRLGSQVVGDELLTLEHGRGRVLVAERADEQLRPVDLVDGFSCLGRALRDQLHGAADVVDGNDVVEH